MDVTLANLEERVSTCDEVALAELFDRYRNQLRKVVECRLDRRLKQRIDAADVLQETYIDLTKKMATFAAMDDQVPVFIWMRRVAIERLIQVHRRHLGAEKRDARREVSLLHFEANSAQGKRFSEHVLGFSSTAAGKAIRAEMHEALLTTLNSLNKSDHEIIMMRCFENLTNIEVAQALELSENGASSRFVRAILRLKRRLSFMPGFTE